MAHALFQERGILRPPRRARESPLRQSVSPLRSVPSTSWTATFRKR